MLVIGNINPDNNITGNINPIKEIIIAVCWVSEMVEINIPSDKALIIKRTLSKPNKNRLPATGMSNIKMLNNTMTTAFMMDKKIYGKTFPMIT